MPNYIKQLQTENEELKALVFDLIGAIDSVYNYAASDKFAATPSEPIRVMNPADITARAASAKEQCLNEHNDRSNLIWRTSGIDVRYCYEKSTTTTTL
jgi:hypothetical protein